MWWPFKRKGIPKMGTVYTYCVPVVKRWEATATVGPDTDWFPKAISAVDSTTTFPVKHTIQGTTPEATVVELHILTDLIPKVMIANAGNSQNANAGYHFELILWPGDTYNIRHKTGIQNVSCKIFETDNVDI